MSYHLLTGLALGASLMGCTSWQAQDVAPEQGDEPRSVRVTRTDGSQVVIRNARITPAGVHGQWERTSAMIPAAEIREIAVRREDASSTIALIAGVVGVAGAVGAVAIGGGDPGSDLR